MSRGPTSEVDESEGGDYADAFKAANRMVDEGRSWSGHERNRCFLNTRRTRFANISAAVGLDFLDDARAIASVDWDHDGDLDLIQMNRTGPQLRYLQNDWSNGHHWLSVRLVGIDCNRDAIGARVELYRRGLDGKDVRTLYAGSSFLSQSSKWIHFGLGQDDSIERLVVRWPGGADETFTGVLANNRYLLMQGHGRAEIVARRTDVSPRAPSRLKHPGSERARVVLASPVPLPTLPYTEFDGSVSQVTWGQPTLIQLWASWCPMCEAEMAELTDRQDEIRESRIRIMALCVDGLGADPTDPSTSEQVIKQRRFPFESARATEVLLDKLEVLRGDLFSNRLPFPVPTSLLIDEQGRLAALYLGPLDVDRLLTDLGTLDDSEDERRRASAPVLGRWFTEPKSIRLSGLATAYREAGYIEDAEVYTRMARPQMALSHCSLALDAERLGNLSRALAHYRQALELGPRVARVHDYYGRHLMRRKKVAAAGESFRQALRLDPELAEAHYHLGSVYVYSRHYDEAKACYRQTLELDAKHAEAHTALGRLLQREGSIATAMNHLRAAIEIDKAQAPAHVYLATIHASQDRPAEAERHFKEALRIHPELADAQRQLAYVLAGQGRVTEAIPHLRNAVRNSPRSHGAALQLAWCLATFDDAQIRDGREAIQLAENLARSTRYQSPAVLDVLAAAYAEASHFNQAVAAATKALQLARRDDNVKLAKPIQERLALYQTREPFRQSNSKEAFYPLSSRNDIE